MSRARNLSFTIMLASIVAAAPLSSDDVYPARPVRIISPYAAGDTPDTVVRVIAEHLIAWIEWRSNRYNMACMSKKLTITISDEVYEGLHRRIGPRGISRFIDELARRHVLERPTMFQGTLAAAYREMAADEEGERDASAWAESLIGETLPDEDFSGWSGYPSR